MSSLWCYCIAVPVFVIVVPCFAPLSANWFNTSLMSNSFTLLGCGREQLRTLSVVDVTKSARLDSQLGPSVCLLPPAGHLVLNSSAFTGHGCAVLASRSCWPKVVSASFVAGRRQGWLYMTNSAWKVGSSWSRLARFCTDSEFTMALLDSVDVDVSCCYRTCTLARQPAPFPALGHSVLVCYCI